MMHGTTLFENCANLLKNHFDFKMKPQCIV